MERKRKGDGFEEFRSKIYPWIREIPSDEKGWEQEGYSCDDTPLLSFVDGMMTVFAVRVGEDAYEILRDDMVPDGMATEEIYQIACANLARDVEFVFSNTLYGGFGVIADGIHEASALCLRHIWDICTEKLQDDVVIMVPSRDLVLFAPKSDKKSVEAMFRFGEQGWEQSEYKVTRKIFQYSGKRKELTVYEEH